MGVAQHLRTSTLSTMAYFLEGKTVEEVTLFSSYQWHRRYYELSLYFLVLQQTFWNVFGPCVSLFVAIIGRDSLIIVHFEEPRRLPLCYYYSNRLPNGVHKRHKKRRIEGPEAGWDLEAYLYAHS